MRRASQSYSDHYTVHQPPEITEGDANGGADNRAVSAKMC